MATLQIENLPEHIYDYLQSLATKQKISLNETVIQLLQQINSSIENDSVEQTRNTVEILERIRSRPRRNPLELEMPDSTMLIREDRDR
jgi:antitoxin FitA